MVVGYHHFWKHPYTEPIIIGNNIGHMVLEIQPTIVVAWWMDGNQSQILQILIHHYSAVHKQGYRVWRVGSPDNPVDMCS